MSYSDRVARLSCEENGMYDGGLPVRSASIKYRAPRFGALSDCTTLDQCSVSAFYVTEGRFDGWTVDTGFFRS